MFFANTLHLQVVDKEWDKYRVAFVITGKAHYVEDDEKNINTKVGWSSSKSFSIIHLLYRNSEAFTGLDNSRVVGLGLVWNTLTKLTRGQDIITWRKQLKSTTSYHFTLTSYLKVSVLQVSVKM